jgi:serine phosphatase RsbU (regulator of sigma subunit)
VVSKKTLIFATKFNGMRKLAFMKGRQRVMATMLTALLLNIVACRNGGPLNSNGGGTDSLNLDPSETVRSVAGTGNVERTEELIDSFMNLGLLTPIQAYGYMANAYANKMDIDNYIECQKKITKAFEQTNAKTAEEKQIYNNAAIALSSYYAVYEKNEEALRVALPAINRLGPDPDVSTDLKGQLLSTIGDCQMKLNRKAEGEKSYEQAYQYILQYQKECEDLESFKDCIAAVVNMFYDNVTQKAQGQQKWLDRCDSLLTWYRVQPDADSSFVDRQDGRIGVLRAEFLHNQGKKAEAAKVYEQFLRTDYSKSDEGRINACDYLSQAGRYAEAADIYQDYDRIAAERDLKPNLEVINGFLFPKFTSNYHAGRKDSALAVALKISQVIDSAVTAQKNDAAAELATIYETQEKEAQIARQQAELSQQRVVGLIIALVMITLFFILYTLYRRRAAKRLAEVRSAKERIENELKIARDIQMSMVPSTFPERESLNMFASMTPAKEVGGDLYGYVLNDDKLYFAVGDVSGKGVPASLFMAQATRLFMTLAKQQMMPAEICTRMNDALSGDDNQSGMFVTFFLGLVDLQTGHLDFCNAGHNPPVIGGGENHGDFLQMEANAPIGLWPGLEYEGEEIETIKGRPLFIYTDGLNEAENRQQEQFGDDRLLDILRHTHFDSAQQVIDTLKAEVDKHRNGAEPNDDLTMMCIRILRQI